jgi:DNA-binding LacI/PurR family transcriptional regulator
MMGSFPALLPINALTTIRQPHQDNGRVAAEQLLGLRPLQGITYPTELVVRGSTAPAPAR